MKSSKLAVATILFLSQLNVTPAAAILGLSTCEKVKKQIAQSERLIYNEIQFWNFRVDSEVRSNLLIRLNNFENKNYAKRIWQTAFNNKKCFTPTQILEINRRTNFEGKSEKWFLIKLRSRSIGFGEECVGKELRKPIDLGVYSSGQRNNVPSCNISPKFYVMQSEYPRSLYSF